MSVQLVQNNYGKSRVRLMKVARRGDWHELQNINVKIAFEGDFDEIHTTGDNSNCLPTDTMKNTVYALAAQTEEIEEIESFGLRLARYFLTKNEKVSRVSVDIIEHKYTRIPTGGQPHPHSFTKSGGEKRTTSIRMTRDDCSIESGLEDLTVIKTTSRGLPDSSKTSTRFCPKQMTEYSAHRSRQIGVTRVRKPRLRIYGPLCVKQYSIPLPSTTVCPCSTRSMRWARPC